MILSQAWTPTKLWVLMALAQKSLRTAVNLYFNHSVTFFNLSLASSVIPNEWKTHKIIPIFKSGDRSLISNYRPISLLCNVSEHIIFNKIINHVTALISPCQFGFLRGRSTTQQLILSLNDIHNAVSKGYQTDVIYLDFKKAFDSVPHTTSN